MSTRDTHLRWLKDANANALSKNFQSVGLIWGEWAAVRRGDACSESASSKITRSRGWRAGPHQPMMRSKPLARHRLCCLQASMAARDTEPGPPKTCLASLHERPAFRSAIRTAIHSDISTALHSDIPPVMLVGHTQTHSQTLSRGNTY